VIDTDDTNKDDIKVLGNFYVYNYVANGDTLEFVSGGTHSGCMHLKATDSGYQVTEFDQVADGSDFTASAKKIFGDEYDDFAEDLSDDTEKREELEDVLEDYIEDNGLGFTKYLEYGYEAVSLFD